jgi:alkyldihydroxyacetonephosphate synthase
MRQRRKTRKDFPVSEHFWLWLIKAFGMPALLATPGRGPGKLPASRLDKTACERLAPWGLRTDDADRLRVSGGRNLPDLLRRRLGDAAHAPDGVLYPRNEAEVQALIILCGELRLAAVPVAGEDGVTAPDPTHKALVAFDMSGMNRILSRDPVSGLMEVEAGIDGVELRRILDAQDMTLDLTSGQTFDTSLGGWIASAPVLPASVRAVRVATPQGTIPLQSGLKDIMAGSRASLGIITTATLAVRPKPIDEECHTYLFRDFAAGIAVLRQAGRAGLPLGPVQLADDSATRFEKAMRQRSNFGRRLFDAWLVLRGFDNGGAKLTVSFSGSPEQRQAARRNLEDLTQAVGARYLGRIEAPRPYPRDDLLDRGVGIDRLRLWASWSELPLHYARLRAGLKHAMRAHPPVTGAHGLVLGHIGDIRSDGAMLTVTWLFPRKLDAEVAQAGAIHQAALALAGKKPAHALEIEMRGAIKRLLDPKDILPGGA